MRLRIATICAIAWLAAAHADACNVPVFRYAMERWPADAYPVVVFHRGELSAAQKSAIDVLEKSLANAEVTTVDLAASDLDEEMKQLWRQVGQAAGGGREIPLPCVVARYPTPKWDKFAWFGPLDEASARRLADSPLRQEISQRLIRGEAAVWVLVESDDKAANDAAEKTLLATLTDFQKRWTPPATQPDDPPMEAGIPTQIKFSTLRLGRGDQAEQVLLGMLLGLGKPFEDAKGPVAFPIFGRGRVLTGLTGEQLTAAVITQAADFITGACSCEVKAQNPGVDLLIATDWTTLAATRPAIGGLPSAQVTAAVGEDTVHPFMSVELRSPWAVWRNAIIASAAALAAVIVGSVLVMRRGRSPRDGGGQS